MKLIRFLILILLIGLVACQSQEPFFIQRGVNISHWLSQSQRRGEERVAWFTQSDVEYLAVLGYDHLRIPIDEEQMFDEQGGKEIEAFTLLHNGIQWCLDNNLRVIVDLHILRSHHFNVEEKPLWTDVAAQQHFIDLWVTLSEELRQYPTNKVAYELLNEAVAADPDLWNDLFFRVYSAVRENEPARVIVLGSNRWQSTDTFDVLRVPENDPNIILSFHFYTPMVLTHYRASWTEVGEYTGPVGYPGQIIEEENLAGLPEDLADELSRHNGYFDLDRLELYLAKPLAKARETGLPLYCGEWGCLPTIAENDRLQWYSDVRTMLEKHNIAWAHWDYKGGFGIYDTQTEQPVTALINVLLDE